MPGKPHGRRSLVGCSSWGHEELDTAEQLHFHFSFSCIGEGNGNPLQCSCLENPRDGGAWCAAVYGVAQSRTRQKRFSSSSSRRSSSISLWASLQLSSKESTCQCRKVKSESEVTQSCSTLRDPMDYSLPGSSIHGVFQARGLEWHYLWATKPALCVKWNFHIQDP